MVKLTSSNNVKAVKESMKEKMAKVKKQAVKVIKKEKAAPVKSSSDLFAELL